MGESEHEPTPVQPIDYRTAPPDGARRSRAVLIVLLILGATLGGIILLLLSARIGTAPRGIAVAIATPAPVTVAPVNYEQQRREDAYAQYLGYAPPTGHVVYEEDPLAAAKLLAAEPQQHRAVSYGNVDGQWANAFQRPVLEMRPADVGRITPFLDNGQLDRCVLFVGKLTSPAGNARLVFLDMDVTLSGGRLAGKQGGGDAAAVLEYVVKIQRKLGYRIFDAAATDGYPTQFRQGTSLTVKTPADGIPIRWIDGSLRAEQPAGASGVRFYAGMRDPQDPAHCTIDYDYAGRRETIDIYLTDDDFLRVLPRAGRTAGGIWEVTGEPPPAEPVEGSATQPAR